MVEFSHGQFNLKCYISSLATCKYLFFLGNIAKTHFHGLNMMFLSEHFFKADREFNQNMCCPSGVDGTNEHVCIVLGSD